MRETGNEVHGAIVDVTLALVFAGELHLEFFDGGVADGHDVARVDRLRGRSGLRFRAEAMAALVHAPVFPRDRAAHLRVGAVAHAVGVPMTAVRLRGDADGHDVLFAIAFFGQDFDGGEVLAVVERELRAQQLGGVEVVVLLVAHEAADQCIVDAVLPDGGRAEAVALAGFEFDGYLRRVSLRIHAHFVAQHARVQVAVGRRGAQQPALERFVVRVGEPVAGLDRQVAGDPGEHRLTGARAGHLARPPCRPPPDRRA